MLVTYPHIVSKLITRGAVLHSVKHYVRAENNYSLIHFAQDIKDALKLALPLMPASSTTTKD
jgi:hypothetical protein